MPQSARFHHQAEAGFRGVPFPPMTRRENSHRENPYCGHFRVITATMIPPMTKTTTATAIQMFTFVVRLCTFTIGFPSSGRSKLMGFRKRPAQPW